MRTDAQQTAGVVAYCKSLVACETLGHSTREGYKKKLCPPSVKIATVQMVVVKQCRSATDRNSNNGRREKENARQRKRWRERQQQEKKRQTESARAQREHMD